MTEAPHDTFQDSAAADGDAADPDTTVDSTDADAVIGGTDPDRRDDAAADAEPKGETLGGARPDPSTTASKDPSDWVTGDEPITGPQKSYLDTLAREAGEELPADMTKAEASENIDRLQQETGRGA
ncbi:DUF3072 domain-containing protein [Nakamurella flavida]|uniref:DUF3072 domain-containing protein n=1 Tax=Nakamurella flavida TaxID=363630 RepID=A0A938YJ49_9ACTN|nr:DUF3072 domain-containing protein [Nakamurella flavida]MBM9475698.1 DUF3072 domain-containing protein [Nakamurella flavida]MDP9778025.1 hypothetical protein [Nakamurella flavida]